MNLFKIANLIAALLLVVASASLSLGATVDSKSLNQYKQNGDVYRLSPGDTISVVIYGEPEMGDQQRIDIDGRVRLPYIDEVELAGMTTREAEAYLEKAYREKELMKAAQVRINLVGSALREVTIIGAVRNPGNFQLPKETTSVDIVEVITRMGGFLPVAKRSAVRIIHLNDEGREELSTIDVDAMMSGARGPDIQRKTFLLYPGDRVIVDQRLF